MARNPAWKRDELLLALELYLERGQLGPEDDDVIELSSLLNRLPLHTDRPDVDKFRNPNGDVPFVVKSGFGSRNIKG